MRTFWTIFISFLVATILAILPLPGLVNWLRPDWITLVLIYWVMAMPQRVSIGWAWVIGLFMDVLFGTVLGEHALALVCVAYFITRLHIRIRLFTSQQQMIMIFVVIIMYRAILLLLHGIMGDISHPLLWWLPSITSTIFWPWIFILLRDCDRRFKVSGLA